MRFDIYDYIYNLLNYYIMKKVLLLLFSFLFFNCAKTMDGEGNIYLQTSIVEIDGCEYIIYSAHNQGNIIHKQNCKNH